MKVMSLFGIGCTLLLVVACGGESSSGFYGGAGGMSTGAVSSGGAGATSMGGGAAGTPSMGGASTGGRGTGVSCGGIQCESWNVLELVEAPACCLTQAPGTCGADLGQVASALGSSLQDPCLELDAPGVPDATCNGLDFTNPITGAIETFPGCCKPDGTCGVVADLSISMSGPNLGCTSPTLIGDPVVPCGGL